MKKSKQLFRFQYTVKNKRAIGILQCKQPESHPAYDNVKNCARRPDNFEWEEDVIMCPIINPHRSCFSAMRVSQGKHR